MTDARQWRPALLFVLCLVSAVAPASAKAHQDDSDDPTAVASTPDSSAERASIFLLVPKPPRLRVHMDGVLADDGHTETSAEWPGGSTEFATCQRWPSCDASLALGLGADWSPNRFLSLGLRARWHRGNDQLTVLGRRWDVVEALFVPQLNVPWRWRWPRGGLRPYLALPFGPAWSFQSRNWSRAVEEEWNSRTGLSVGVALGMEFYWNHRWGWLVEVGYQARFLSADVVSTPVVDPQSQASERMTLRQRQILFSAGLLFGLAP